jgi:hypothetical protein
MYHNIKNKFIVSVTANTPIEDLTIQDLYELQRQWDKIIKQIATQVIDKTIKKF